jgi:hypothetical protein
MASVVLIGIGYAALIAQAGWLGASLILAHLIIMALAGWRTK